MPLLSELVPQMRKGMWAQRGSRPLKNSGWGKDSYVLIEDGEFVIRSGDPTDRSVTCDFNASPADFTFRGWLDRKDPKKFSRVMKRGDIEWMDRAKALLKDHRFSHTICIG